MTALTGSQKTMNWGEEPEFFGPRHYFRESLIVRSLTKRVPKGAYILDAGSGNGSLATRIGTKGYQVLGIEASEEFVAYATARAIANGVNGAVIFQRGDITQIGVEQETFDAIVCGEVLEHIEADERAMDEFSRVLRPGGYCIVTVPAQPHLWDQNDEWAGHFRRYTRDGLARRFENRGFTVLQCIHWGFPLVRLFHQFIYLPLVRKRILRQCKNISREKNFLFQILKNRHLHRAGAFLFKFDNLFNRLPLGIGLLLVARKR